MFLYQHIYKYSILKNNQIKAFADSTTKLKQETLKMCKHDTNSITTAVSEVILYTPASGAYGV